MTNVTSPLFLATCWADEKKAVWIDWEATPMVRGAYRIYGLPPNALCNLSLYQKSCNFPRPKADMTILSCIKLPHPTTDSSEGGLGPGIQPLRNVVVLSHVIFISGIRFSIHYMHQINMNPIMLQYSVPMSVYNCLV